MRRRDFVLTGTLAAAAPAFSTPLFNPSFLLRDMILLRRNVGIYTERGGTIGWLMSPDGIIVIDSQWKEQSEFLISQLKQKSSADFHYLINTHHHGDHTSGNIAYKNIARHILAHENSKMNQQAAAKKNNNEADQLYPDLTYTDQWQYAVGDETIDIQYWGPGHTNGDSIIHFQNANVVHCGDLVFNRRFPYIDKSAGASIENWIEILMRMLSYYDDDTIFIYGHAREGYQVRGGKEDLTAFANYLTGLLELVDADIKNGKSKEQILQHTSIPGSSDWSGDGIERSLTAAYEELTNK